MSRTERAWYDKWKPTDLKPRFVRSDVSHTNGSAFPGRGAIVKPRMVTPGA